MSVRYDRAIQTLAAVLVQTGQVSFAEMYGDSREPVESFARDGIAPEPTLGWSRALAAGVNAIGFER